MLSGARRPRPASRSVPGDYDRHLVEEIVCCNADHKLIFCLMNSGFIDFSYGSLFLSDRSKTAEVMFPDQKIGSLFHGVHIRLRKNVCLIFSSKHIVYQSCTHTVLICAAGSIQIRAEALRHRFGLLNGNIQGEIFVERGAETVGGKSGTGAEAGGLSQGVDSGIGFCSSEECDIFAGQFP